MSANSLPTMLDGVQLSSLEDGVASLRLASWSDFFDFVEGKVFTDSKSPRNAYVWRGLRRSDWSLSTTLDRLFERLDMLSGGPSAIDGRSAEHLDRFKMASRGHRGPNPPALSENEWWALGQHFGLATPLLDWTRSPFVATYFAFEELATDPTEYRAVYGLNQPAVEQKNQELRDGPSFEDGRLPILEFVDPMSNENPRLVSQDGVFTRAPIGTPIEQWVSNAFEGSALPILMRLQLPNSDRIACLRTLSHMNISHRSLFPDLSGASRSTNLRLEFYK